MDIDPTSTRPYKSRDTNISCHIEGAYRRNSNCKDTVGTYHASLFWHETHYFILYGIHSMMNTVFYHGLTVVVVVVEDAFLDIAMNSLTLLAF